MTNVRAGYRMAVASAACLAGLLGSAPALASASPMTVPAAAAASVNAAGPTAPTNLRVTQLARTSVLFQWDHSQGNQPGCTVPIVMYAIFVNGVLHGWTLYGSPVGYVAQLRPGTTYRLAVLGRDNCTGLISPLSEPLTVTTR